ncbi:GRP family sugar transporter [Phocaeicola coprocola]|uniref:GRP family sugar transporter n=1 Tax=Phocaeicola coprocola TaxID=310298 RepID=UPI0026703AB4|nr:GRP family sugar transporter [Phocaeicola coprocola]
MFIVDNYPLAVFFCFITMLCWGSWGNTQKITDKNWRFELYYWDYVLGVLLFSLFLGFSFGSIGEQGRPFVSDLLQADTNNLLSCIIGGTIFNASNILLTASMALAGMSVAFPLGVGIALVLGVFVNYFTAPKGDAAILFIGVLLIMIAIICNGVAAGKLESSNNNKAKKKGIVLALIAGLLMAFFYRFVAAAMDLNNFESPTTGMLTPYSAFFVFALGLFLSNLVFNSFIMRHPFIGNPVRFSDYRNGKTAIHLIGILGGAIWALGTSLSYIAAGKAGAAISYALGQGAPMIAAIWGVFVWKEFKGAPKSVNHLLALMFVLFITGLGLIVISGGN